MFPSSVHNPCRWPHYLVAIFLQQPRCLNNLKNQIDDGFKRHRLIVRRQVANLDLAA